MTATSPISGSAVDDLRVLNQTFVSLAADAAPSVVEIRALASGPRQMMAGGGSGFVYREDGWIVTNDHVVGGAKKVTVVLNDGKSYEGTVYSPEDEQLDLAVVKIDAKGLKPLPLADSDEVRTGQFAIAVGSPFGFESTVTIGHVSAVNRPGLVMDPRTGQRRSYEGMIQTDAAINPGNSGGPLMDIYGRVIGVNSTISTTTGGSNGIGFSLPANTVKAVADELISTKKFDRGFLGITFREGLKPYQLKELGIDGGALIAELPEANPAYKAGLRSNDVITRIDNEAIKSQNDLLISMYRRSPGDEVEVTFRRGGETKKAKVTLADRSKVRVPDQEIMGGEPNAGPEGRGPNPEEFFRQWGPDFFDRAPRSEGRTNPGERPRLGVTIESITPENRTQFSIPQNVEGVVVTSVDPGSLAQRLGVPAGAVIKEINQVKVSNPADLTRELSKIQSGGTVALSFSTYRNGRETVNRAVAPFN
jgi:serine protease Do